MGLAALFPSQRSLVVFVTYMALFINQGILVTASKSSDNSYHYNTVTVVLLTEVLKLLTAALAYLKGGNSVSQLVREFVTHKKVLALYFIPAALYCLYNNLAFVNLSNYDPTTYYLLLQFRVVVTGVVFQILFKKSLSRMQWLSLVILTAGCVIKEVNHGKSTDAVTAAPDAAGVAAESTVSWSSYLDANLVLIMLQVFASCFAGVYNEFLLKNTGAKLHIMMSNMFMYVNSIICNVLVLAFTGDLLQAFTPDAINSIAQPGVLAIVANSAGIGIVTSLFLRNLNSILKTFASALELLFTAVLSWFIFAVPLDMYTFIAIAIVIAATLLYANNPVVERPRAEADESVKETKVDRS